MVPGLSRRKAGHQYAIRSSGPSERGNRSYSTVFHHLAFTTTIESPRTDDKLIDKPLTKAYLHQNFAPIIQTSQLRQ